MDITNLIKSVELKDDTSPRAARYIIRLGRLAEGYVVETAWGGMRDRKHSESYFRPTLASARDKFDKILAAKTAGRRSSRRCYQPTEGEEQLSFTGLLA